MNSLARHSNASTISARSSQPCDLRSASCARTSMRCASASGAESSGASRAMPGVVRAWPAALSGSLGKYRPFARLTP
jgi:hypothetical protein